MTNDNPKGKDSVIRNTLREKHYKDILVRQIIRHFVFYVLPIIVITLFFKFQYQKLSNESAEAHIKSIAESQSKLLDLFLQERLLNLTSLFDSFDSEKSLDSLTFTHYLEQLKSKSPAFIDIGFFNSEYIQTAYAGSLPELEKKDYSKEEWIVELSKSDERYIITDIYLGLRNEPHFTIAIKNCLDDDGCIFRATLDPKIIYDYMTTFESSNDVLIAIINHEGEWQLSNDLDAFVSQVSPFKPNKDIPLGVGRAQINSSHYICSYAWLKTTNWAVIARRNTSVEEASFWSSGKSVNIISIILILIMSVISIVRARKMVKLKIDKDITTTQLEHAAKLASIGELAAGIAHEINNPLAIIASEAGLIKDLIDPQFSQNTELSDLAPHLNNIRESAFRGRDITRKLLAFVRQDEIKFAKHNIHNILNNIIDSFFQNELSLSNISIKKQYNDEIPDFVTDENQLKQVFVNIFKNAVDAIESHGKITVSTDIHGNKLSVAIHDTGTGMTEEQLSKIFLPFFTTKDVGKGTGLGLSVSYSIIKNFEGTIVVESILGKGSIFTITLPIKG